MEREGSGRVSGRGREPSGRVSWKGGEPEGKWEGRGSRGCGMGGEWEG